MKKKIMVTLLAVAMIATFSLTGCGSKSDDSSSSSSSSTGGKTLIIQDSSWEGVDMYQVSSWNDFQCLLADSIETQNPETKEAEPCICSKSVWSKDGLTWTLTFPKGMKYSTGEELEPEDFVASVNYGKKVSPYADGYANIKSMDIDGRNVIVHLKEYQADMEFNFCQCFTGVIDKDEIDSMSKDDMLWGCHPYGAYYLDEYQPGAYAILKANPGYVTYNPNVENKKACPIKKIKVDFTGEDFTFAEGIQKGTYDVLTYVPTDYYDELSKNKDITVTEAQGAQIYYSEINMTDTLFQDKNVRKALIMSIDRDNLKSYLNAYETPCYSLILPKCMNYDKAAETYYKENYGYNKAEAEKLFKAAGWTKNSDGILEKNGKTFTFTFDCRDDATAKKVAQALQAQFKDVGVQMKITTQDWSYVNQDVVDGKFQMAYLGLGWSEPFLLMDMFCERNAKCTNPDETGQQAMVAKARKTVDYNERTPQITALQEKLMDYCTIVPLLNETNYRCWRSEIQGIKYTKNGGFWLDDVKVDSDGNFRNVK